ncbi:hypothetical protein [Anaerotignum sp.]|uniref:hypothetical protein n=1 Tax=Anaerotignum sp. TaxID=2039241 RepID=UPI002A91B1F1|nr:hypothetical protein [Anaerotignum sp.]MCI7657557.1 hypothetical protein [Clostridia bacterium]MDY5415336.1 hypothetical protein [Anaerotignum sp.]
MGAFEFENNADISARCCGCNSNNNQSEACIIAQKIFDQCRIQKCLSPDILGPARSVCGGMNGCNDMMCDGDIIIPPVNAATVTMHNPELSRIDILRKCPNTFREGCWDMELRYVFDYTLEFRRADGCPIGCTDATSSYTLKVTLFGSTESDVTTVSDLFDCCGNSHGGPFVTAEGKAVGLAAELKYPGCGCNSCCNNCGCNNCGCGNCSCNSCGCGNCGCDNGDASMGAPIAVNVTLGLFTIVKLFRTVNMLVHSFGNCVPEPCSLSTNGDADPCRNFDCIPFPLDLFSPSTQPRSCCGFGDTFGSAGCREERSCNSGCGSNSCENNCNSGCGSNSCGNSCNSGCGSNSCNNSCNSGCGSNSRGNNCNAGCGSNSCNNNCCRR